ncbi:MAG: glycosyltransferase family 4 protein [Prolixibacteraceae bacterium]|nr:glycosyltransferase family 4 protein [Prolixibacteraceae bacterium]
MNLLLLTNKPPYPAKDGGAISMMNLIRKFSEQGHKLTVLSMNTRKHTTLASDIPPEIRKTADFHFVDVPAKISYSAAFFNLIFSHEPYNAVRFISADYQKKLEKLLSKNNFDVVQLEGLYLCPYIPAIREKSNAAIVYRAHNVEYEIWERTAAISSGLKKLYLRNLAHRLCRFEQKTINQYDLLVPFTARDAAIFNKMGNNRPLLVSPASVDWGEPISEISQIEYPSLFHIGSLEWAPNQDGLIWFLDNCWTRIHKKFPSLNFYIAGRNAPEWLTPKFRTPGITFLGEVDDARMFMNSKAVMVVPLLSGSGMRVKIVEGMALGKVIVSTTIGAEGIGAVQGKNILLADTPDDFVVQVSALVENKDLFLTIGRDAAGFARENFDAETLAAKLLDFYKKHCS